MQPYFFPYLGYWQLIHAVDAFVIFDDVNYFNRGFINRNSILVNGKAHRVTLQVEKASQNKRINEHKVGNNQAKILKTLQYSYKKSPFFTRAYPVVEAAILNPHTNLADYLSRSIEIIAQYLGIDTKIIRSSDSCNSLGKAQEKVISICKEMSAGRYINAIGGQEIYDNEKFRQEGLELRFLETMLLSYKQFGNDFVPNLSIIDLMMFNGPKDMQRLLGQYRLI